MSNCAKSTKIDPIIPERVTKYFFFAVSGKFGPAAAYRNSAALCNELSGFPPASPGTPSANCLRKRKQIRKFLGFHNPDLSG